MIVGYMRVSTGDPKPGRQLDHLRTQGCEKIYVEKMTGTTTARPELRRMLDALRKGDILVIDSFCGLCRSTKDLLDVVERLRDAGVELVSLKEQLDTTTAVGRLMMATLSALSQFERDLVSQQARAGLRAIRAEARRSGGTFGGKSADKRPTFSPRAADAVKSGEGRKSAE